MFMSAVYVSGMPALSRRHTVKQPDGTTITVFLRGDEHMHYYETEDGVMILPNKDGFLYYAEISDDGIPVSGRMRCHDMSERTAEEESFVVGLDQARLRTAMKNVMKDTPMRVAPGYIRPSFPTEGDVRGLVVLAQFPDVSFSGKATVEDYYKLLNENNYTGNIATGSINDYFQAQSFGKLRLDFDVVGPVTLSHNMAYYGSANANATKHEERVAEMVSEAVRLAKESEPQLDFSLYDKDGDDFVDFVFVIYAGYGEAQSAIEETIWPQASSLAYIDYTYYDGKLLGNYACSCELYGGTDDGVELDGIGTFCHEFSHILGLPDIYDPAYTGCAGMGSWDVMDIGGYNDKSRTPAGYTAMDKYTLGWIVPEVLEGDCDVELEALSTSNKSYFIVSKENPNEYFTLENRQPSGWDAALPGHGLLISHVEYDAKCWGSNIVNTNGREHVALVVADAAKKYGEKSDDRDIFPGRSGQSSFSGDTKPCMLWNNGNETGCSLTEIREEDGIVKFRFSDTSSGIFHNVIPDDISISSGRGFIEFAPSGVSDGCNVYSLDGRKIANSTDVHNNRISLPAGVYIIRMKGKSTTLLVK